MPPRRISEEYTRKEMIDPQLEKAGWYLRDHSKVKIEIPVDGYNAEPWNGVLTIVSTAKMGKCWPWSKPNGHPPMCGWQKLN